MIKCCSIDSILENAKKYDPINFLEYLESEKINEISKIQEQHEKTILTKAKKVAFIAPQLPHPCELEIWNNCVKKLGVEGSLYTHISEERNFIQFAKLLHNSNTTLYLTCYTLDSMNENKTFLSGLEKELEDYQLII